MGRGRVLVALALAIWAFPGASATAGTIVSARYTEPTERYPHAVLGDGIEHGALEIRLRGGRTITARIDPALVFEDTVPRLADLDGDGSPEIVTVESHQQQGARLTVWGLSGGTLARLASAPFIGTRFRWLAVVGAADLDGDGRIEIAYVDRPHLAKTLRIWRYDPAGGPDLTEVVAAAGHTNHRIGERDIAGGIRTCGSGPELLTARADWSEMLATRLEGGVLMSRVIGTDTSRAAFQDALACRD